MNKLFAKNIGVSGMVAGQVDDIVLEHTTDVTIEMLKHVQQNKTGKLFTCAIVGSALVAQYPTEVIHQLEIISHRLGTLFQLVDDYLDDDPTTGKTIGIDAINNKPTFLSILGKNELKEFIIQNTQDIEKLLDELKILGYNITVFSTILSMIIKKV